MTPATVRPDRASSRRAFHDPERQEPNVYPSRWSARAGPAVLLAAVASAAGAQQAATLSKPDAETRESFTLISSIRELPSGRVLVADRQDKVVQLVDLSAGASTRVGREGQGPGEYGLPFTLLGLPNGETLLYDLLGRRFLILGLDGKPGGILEMPGPGRAAPDRFQGIALTRRRRHRRLGPNLSLGPDQAGLRHDRLGGRAAGERDRLWRRQSRLGADRRREGVGPGRDLGRGRRRAGGAGYFVAVPGDLADRREQGGGGPGPAVHAHPGDRRRQGALPGESQEEPGELRDRGRRGRRGRWRVPQRAAARPSGPGPRILRNHAAVPWPGRGTRHPRRRGLGAPQPPGRGT